METVWKFQFIGTTRNTNLEVLYCAAMDNLVFANGCKWHMSHRLNL
mgnify:CR=1 FL=1